MVAADSLSGGEAGSAVIRIILLLLTIDRPLIAHRQATDRRTQDIDRLVSRHQAHYRRADRLLTPRSGGQTRAD
jgi:hypothetical protein